MQSRRSFLTGAAVATVGAATIGMPEWAGATNTVSPDKIVRLFSKLPGTVAVKIVAPKTRGKRRFEVALNSAERLFIGSAFKTFVLAEALRQADSPDVVRTIADPTRPLALDASVWNLDARRSTLRTSRAP